MEDQIDNLADIGIDRCIAITSQMTAPEDRSRALELLGQGEYLFVYVAPERFQTIEFRESLRMLAVHKPIALIVVDEAHCVSEWGHDFRTAYLNIGRTSRIYCESQGRIPPLFALTGTASRTVLKDIQRELQIEDFEAIITPKTFDRSELSFQVIFSRSEEKSAVLKGYLGQKLPSMFNTTPATFYQPRGKSTCCGLVFCPHVDGEFGVVTLSEEIAKSLGIAVGYYSGRNPKYANSYEYRDTKRRVTKEFKLNRMPLLVCTKAFGMGIDKPNVRYTIHLGVPPSIESFYQEAGRAGRDKNPAYCCIVVSNDDPKRTEKLLNPNTRIEEIETIIKSSKWTENDDITRVLYFHTRAFRGIAQERQDISDIIRQLGDVTRRETKKIAIADSERGFTEKAIHRLLLIGLVADYTIDYSHDEFTIRLSGASKEEILETYGKYVASYLLSRKQKEVEKASRYLHLPFDQFIMEMVDLLLHFIYDVLERGRRRALQEMLLVCTDSRTSEAMRQRILRYLEATEFSESLEDITTRQDAGIERVKDVWEGVSSSNEAAELRGQVSRYLESYPDHPGLLMLRSLSEFFARDRNVKVAEQNFGASISSALTDYGLRDETVFEFAAWAVSNIVRRDKESAKRIIMEMTQLYPKRDIARRLVEQLPIALGQAPAWFLLAKLQEYCVALIHRNGE